MLKSHQGPLTLDSILGKRKREFGSFLSLSLSTLCSQGFPSGEQAVEEYERRKVQQTQWILKAKSSKPRGRLQKNDQANRR
jgi:hypothetical protein